MGMDEAKIHGMFSELQKDIRNIGARMTSLETKVDGMAGQLKLNCSKLDKMQEDIDSLKDSGQA